MSGAAWLASGAGVTAAGAAWFAAINGVRTLNQSRQDGMSKSRPMVAAEFEDAYPAHAVLYLVIKNHGPSVAKDVRVTFTPEIPDPAPGKAASSVVPYLKKRYANAIMTLTPGIELRNVYFVGNTDTDTVSNKEDVPDAVTVTITYRSADRKQKYTDTYELDVDVMRGGTRVSSSNSVEWQTKEAVKTLKKMTAATEAISKKLPK
ncbi:hypothetical protein ABZ905_36450 [Streptomyces parvus]|uniref:hypothetical protein n=1 Tax=Streptomyces parvus TaxID=66428 RepID=UPI0034057D07